MTEELTMIYDEFKEANQKSLIHLENELIKIRAGKASPAMLNSVMIEYYGSMTPLHQVANVNTTDARTIIVQPWEKPLLNDIAKGIINANLGLNPQNNGEHRSTTHRRTPSRPREARQNRGRKCQNWCAQQPQRRY
jgi:ribosome recycling factor